MVRGGESIHVHKPGDVIAIVQVRSQIQTLERKVVIRIMAMGGQVFEVIRRTLSRNSPHVQCRLQFQFSQNRQRR